VSSGARRQGRKRVEIARSSVPGRDTSGAGGK
jgi:hypothetical protein